MDEGLEILAEVRKHHRRTGADRRAYRAGVAAVAAVVDVYADTGLPVPPDRFHSTRAAAAGKPVNIKKGQFLSPWDMKNVVDKGARGQRQPTTSWCASAARPSATTIWYPTCAR